MQVISHGGEHDGSQELAEILSQSTVLSMTDHGQVRMYVLHCNGQDILMFADPSNRCYTVYPCEAFDAEFGGSIHDQARACLEH